MAWTPDQKRAARRTRAEARPITGGVCVFCGHAGRVQQARRWDERPVGEACWLCARAVYLMGASRAWAARFDWPSVLAAIGTDPIEGSVTYVPCKGIRTDPDPRHAEAERIRVLLTEES